MIILLLHLLRLLPFLCGGHRQLALENLALRQQLAVYKRTANRPKLQQSDRLLWVWHHPDFRSRWPASSLRPPGGVVSAPHPPIFIATNAYTPAASLLRPGRRPSSTLRKTSSHRVKSTSRGCRQPLPPYEYSASCRLSEQRERSPSEADAVLAKDRSPNKRYPDSYPAPV